MVLPIHFPFYVIKYIKYIFIYFTNRASSTTLHSI